MGDTLDSAIDSAFTAATTTPGSEAAASAASNAPSTAGNPPAPASAAPAAVAGQSPTDAKPAGAITPPSDDDETITDATTFTLEKHKRILDNARKKEAAKVEARVREEYGLPRDEIQAFSPHIAFIKQHGWAAYHRALSQQFAPPAPPPSTPSRPAPDLVASDGTPAYSAPQLEKLLSFDRQQQQEELKAMLSPLQQTQQTIQSERLWADAVSQAEGQLKEASGWEGFAELKTGIADLMKRDGRYSLEGAYNKLFQTEYLPGMKARARQAAIDELKQRPAGTSQRPSTPPVAPRSGNGRAKSLDARIDSALEQAIAAASA